MNDTTQKELSGLVFDVKRFALHDGHGIRTTAFLKGCPLSCPWCQNPEGIARHRLVWYDAQKCIRCGACEAACPLGAISTHPEEDHFVRIDRRRCDSNGACVGVCPTGALHWDSSEYTVGELADLLERDAVFYTSSEGGVTLSGGEPLDQAEFAYEVLAECKRRGLHTAIETTLFTARATLERFLAVTDLFLTDLKIWDPQVHKETVGVDNALIKDNILYLAQNGVDLVIRMPLIPEITATAENIRPIAAFVRDLPGNVPFELINFNPLASGKYRILDRNYAFESYTSPYAQEEYNEFIAVAAEQGGRVLASG